MENLLLSPIPLRDLIQQFRQILKEELSEREKDDLSERLLNAEETCNLFEPKISKVTLHNWSKQGKLIKHHIGGRVAYKYSEVMEALKTVKRYQKITNEKTVSH